MTYPKTITKHFYAVISFIFNSSHHSDYVLQAGLQVVQ